MHLLAHGGMLPVPEAPGKRKMSRKLRGVMQGLIIFFSGLLLVPMFGVMASFAPGRISDVFGFFAAMSAVVCFIGGVLRTLFAAIFEEGAPPAYVAAPSYAPPAVAPPAARVSALPPPEVSTQPWRSRPQTAEIVPPTSVPDHTTKLLEKSESERD